MKRTFVATLDIYFIDTEGGQATLLVTPSGQTMLIDSGFADADPAVGRDASRIAAAAKLANANRIDVFMPTHFHGDHVGGVEQVAARLPIGLFRFANFGDMPWNKEVELLCPENKAGRIDVYQTPAHGREPSNAVYTMAPRVAVADNGARKGAPGRRR